MAIVSGNEALDIVCTMGMAQGLSIPVVFCGVSYFNPDLISKDQFRVTISGGLAEKSELNLSELATRTEVLHREAKARGGNLILSEL